jgi:hypothetical protein
MEGYELDSGGICVFYIDWNKFYCFVVGYLTTTFKTQSSSSIKWNREIFVVTKMSLKAVVAYLKVLQQQFFSRIMKP